MTHQHLPRTYALVRPHSDPDPDALAVLRQAVAEMRLDAGLFCDRENAYHHALADWLEMCAGAVENYGPNADSPWVKPHTQMALAVARAYLGDES